MANKLEIITRQEWVELLKENMDSASNAMRVYLDLYTKYVDILEETIKHIKAGKEIEYLYDNDRNSMSYRVIGKKPKRSSIGFKFGEDK